MSIDINDDRQLWSTNSRDNRDARYHSDFYDEYARQQLWPNTFAKAYNKEIDMEEQKKDLVELAVNPKHYRNVAAGKQYMELMVDMLANKSGVEAHLFGQVYKYLMRCGGKDNEVQELKKTQWYLDALIKYKTEGKVL